jgi:glycosyltransferase involved in cell wall biosynthesis
MTFPAATIHLEPETRRQGLHSRSPRLSGKRAAMVVFSPYPGDPRPRRAAEAIIEEGMAVDLLCEREPDSKPREGFGMLNVTRIPIEHHRGGMLSYAYQYSAFILASTAILAWRTLWKRYDLVYVHNMPDVLVICALIPKLFGAKVILDQHDPMPELMMTIFGKKANNRRVQFVCAMEKWSLKRADRVITVNDACLKLFSSRGCPKQKIRVVMNSPDERRLSYRAARSYSRPVSEGPFVIMYHGSLVERNGLELAVAALAKLRESLPQAELRVYGRSTSYLEQVFAIAEKLGVRDRVRFLGIRSMEQLGAEIQACDIGVIPNQQNAFTDINTPTRIFEYLALGKPVIAPNTPGILDYFGPNELFYFRSGDATGMADAILRAATNWTEGVAIAERGQQIYFQHTWQRERETLVQSVCDLLAEKTAPAGNPVGDLEKL